MFDSSDPSAASSHHGLSASQAEAIANKQWFDELLESFVGDKKPQLLISFLNSQWWHYYEAPRTCFICSTSIRNFPTHCASRPQRESWHLAEGAASRHGGMARAFIASLWSRECESAAVSASRVCHTASSQPHVGERLKRALCIGTCDLHRPGAKSRASGLRWRQLHPRRVRWDHRGACVSASDSPPIASMIVPLHLISMHQPRLFLST